MVKRITTKTFFKLLVSYIIVLIMIVIFFTVNYCRIAKSIMDEKISETIITLQRTCNSVDEQISRVRRQLHNISLNDKMRRIALIDTVLLPQQYQWLIDAYNFMSEYELAGGIIDECVIMFNPKIPFMLTTKHIVANPHVYYNGGLFKYNNMNYQEFMEYLLSVENANYRYGYFWPNMNTNIYHKGTVDVVTFVLPLQIHCIKTSPIALILINSEKIKDLAFPFSTSDDGWFCVTDTKGNILLSEYYDGQPLPESSDKASVFFSGPDLIISVTSPHTNLAYYVSISNNWLKEQIKPLWTAFYFVLFISITIGVIISASFAYYNIKPVSRVIKNISKRFFPIEKSGDPYDYIEKSFNTIITLNEEMIEKLEKWGPIVKSGLYERVFKNGIVSKHEYELIPEVEMCATEFFRVVVIGWQPYPGRKSQYNVKQILLSISDCIEKYFKTHVIHPLDGEKVAVLLCKNEYEHVDLLIDKLAKLNEHLSTMHDMLFAIGVGGEYTGLSFISISCSEARSVLAEINDWNECRVMDYGRSKQRMLAYNFSFEDMERLCNYMLAGDKKSLQMLMEQIYHKNFYDKAYNDISMRQFYNDLMRILTRVALELPADDILKNISGLPCFANPYEIKCYFLAIFQRAADISNKQKTTASKELIRRMLDYIENNYSDPDISLQKLAAEFNMSDKYVSLFFKEKTGTNFSKFLENKRLTKAVNLMKGTDKSIEEIQQVVGYISINTFYKAFRRKYGMSPAAWRNQMKKDKSHYF